MRNDELGALESLEYGVPDEAERRVMGEILCHAFAIPPGGEVAWLELADDVLPEQAGAWRLEVEGGRGRLVKGGAGSLRLDARGLAAWCTGFASPHTLAQLGLAHGAREVLDGAGSIMAGPAPWMREMF